MTPILQRMQHGKRPATLSLDLDNEWSYLKTHGDNGRWKEYPTYLDIVVPRIISVLRELNVKLTVFVVGRDAALEKNACALRLLAREGYEIGNHSHEHDAGAPQTDEHRFTAELAEAEESITRATGTRPNGFRGPGFTASEEMLNVLAKKGYRYDASSLPTFIGPLARFYYFWMSKLTREQRKSRRMLFGTLGHALRPIKPHYVGVNGTRLLEIPVTTTPFLRIPFHISYILYLSTFSPAVARSYWRMALRLCQWTRTPPSVLLHPLDFLGCDDVSTLSFFPGMSLTGSVKRARVMECLKTFVSRFEVLPLGEFCSILESRRGWRQASSSSHHSLKEGNTNHAHEPANTLLQ